MESQGSGPGVHDTFWDSWGTVSGYTHRGKQSLHTWASVVVMLVPQLLGGPHLQNTDLTFGKKTPPLQIIFCFSSPVMHQKTLEAPRAAFGHGTGSQPLACHAQQKIICNDQITMV